jgi:hypothetical protein
MQWLCYPWDEHLLSRIKWEAAWVPEQFRTHWKREKSLVQPMVQSLYQLSYHRFLFIGNVSSRYIVIENEGDVKGSTAELCVFLDVIC